jgi:pyridoxamine 5'-phosphate oxidase
MDERLPDILPADPMHWAEAWLLEAGTRQVRRNPNAMSLATVSADGQPSNRIVLCKSFHAEPGYLVFYTNYRSQKARDIEARPKVAVNFHWDSLGRQVRLQGCAVRSPAAESDDYFATRDWGSQLGAWGSDQSSEIASRAALFRQVRDRAEKLGVSVTDNLQSLAGHQPPDIPRPPHWGGYRVWPTRIELWIEGTDRIHDRAAWNRQLDSAGTGDFRAGPWTGTRLQP